MSITQEKLLHETYETAFEYSIKLIEGINTFKSKLEINPKDAFKLFPEIIEGLEWFIQATSLTQKLQKYHLNIEEINKIFEELNDAIENRDNSLLVDILEYEIEKKIVDWQKLNMPN